MANRLAELPIITHAPCFGLALNYNFLETLGLIPIQTHSEGKGSSFKQKVLDMRGSIEEFAPHP